MMVEKDILSTLTHEMTGSSPCMFEKKINIYIYITNGHLQNPDPRKHEKVRKLTNIQLQENEKQAIGKRKFLEKFLLTTEAPISIVLHSA